MAIDFTLTSYQRRLQKIAREFANEILAPVVRAADEDPDPQRAFEAVKGVYVEAYKLGFATGYGIFVSALTTIVGFGTLMIAQHRGVASLGLALAVGQTACMITALVFLPALLGMISRKKLMAKMRLTPTESRIITEAAGQRQSA